jgi:hypothetical protein
MKKKKVIPGKKGNGRHQGRHCSPKRQMPESQPRHHYNHAITTTSKSSLYKKG